MRKIAVDVGSGFTKYTDGVTSGCIPSVVTDKPTAEVFGMEDADQILMQTGELYLIGESAVNFGDPDGRHDTLSDSWAASPGWMALIFSSVARLLGEEGAGEKIQLIAGVPQALYSTHKDDVLAKLQGSHSFQSNGIQFNIEVEPTVIPQAASALFFQASKNESILEDVVGCIDVGTYTTGFSVINKGVFVGNKSGGCPVGVSHLIDELQGFLLRTKGMTVDPATLPDTLRTRKIRHQGENVDLDHHITDMAASVARPMIQAINDKWKGGSELTIFITGGGAPHFHEVLKKIMPHALVMEESFYSVVKGMHVYLTELTA